MSESGGKEQGALAGIRVVDIAGTVASGYCGKLFADHGAEVINLEPAAGFATRQLPPFVDAAASRSALHEYLSTGKHSVVPAPDHDDLAARLCAGATVVLDGGGAELASASLASIPVRSSLSWFGSSGPYAGFAGSDGLCFALSGLVKGMGSIEGPPLMPTGYQAQILGGLAAYIGTLANVIGRERAPARPPVQLETSIFEAAICFTEVAAVGYHNTGWAGRRMGINRFPPTYPLGIFACRDGWLGVTALTPQQWQGFCRLLDLDAFAAEPRYYSTAERLADSALLEPLIMARLRERSARETLLEGQRIGVPLALVPTMAELLEVDHLQIRGAFAPLTFADQPPYQVPVTPFRLRATPPRQGGVVSALGADTARVVTPLPVELLPVEPLTGEPLPGEPRRQRPTAPGAAGASDAPDPGPLVGIRVIDLSMGWAGPLAARHLADLGADIIKVESCERFDWWRSWEATPEWIASDGAEKSVSFNTMNRGKRAITLDFEDPDGRALLLQLVAGAHAVVENFSAGVLPKFGLDYAALKAVNPALVMVSMPAFGAAGPWKPFRAYGSTVEHASGLPHLNGSAGDPPTMHHVAYGDPVAGLNGAAALLTALRHQARTGEGQFVDLSQVECLLPLAVHGILAQSATGSPPPRMGNDSRWHAPHGVYPCAGDDAWIAIQVFDEAQWRALQIEAGAPLADFGDLQDRLQRREALNAALAVWTGELDARALMTRLQAAGVPAAAVSDARALFEDPHLQARGYWQWLQRPVVGLQPNPSAAYREAGRPYRIRTPSPTLGQHNEAVLGGLLGLSAEAMAALAARGIIGTRPRMRGARRPPDA